MTRCWPFRHRWALTGGLDIHAYPFRRVQYRCERCGAIRYRMARDG